MKKSYKSRVIQDFKRHKYKYLVVLPVIVYMIVFHYKPMYGVIIAFKQYRPTLGITDSPWVGFDNFEYCVIHYPLVFCRFCLVSLHLLSWHLC